MGLTIITNNVPRDVLEASDDEAHFFYKGQKYYLADFLITRTAELQKAGWDGIHTDTYFSAIIVKPVDGSWEQVIVGRCYS